MTAKPVVIDCDPNVAIPGADIDDCVALALAVRSPAVELLAVTTVSGNVTVERGTEAALQLLELMEADDVPVHRGAERPLVQDPRPWRELLDGLEHHPVAVELWRSEPGLPAPRGRVAETSAARALLDAVTRQPGEVTVVAIGPLTNVASAVLLDSTFAAAVAQIVVMGGAFNLPNALQELNFAYDPEAASIVLSCGARVTVLPLDVTSRSDFTLSDNERLLAAGDPRLRRLGELLVPWISFSSAMSGAKGCSLHDPLALALAIDPTLGTVARGRADIELQGRYTRGRPVFWTPESELEAPGLDLPEHGEIDLVEHVEDRAFISFLLGELCGS